MWAFVAVAVIGLTAAVVMHFREEQLDEEEAGK
jgi:hypothetical protein